VPFCKISKLTQNNELFQLRKSRGSVHGRWTTTGSCGPPWTDGGVDGRTLGHGGVLFEVWPPATPEHVSSPARAQKRGERRELISGLTRAREVVWQSSDGNEVVVVFDLEGRAK
jgi:hypothetical protein